MLLFKDESQTTRNQSQQEVVAAANEKCSQLSDCVVSRTARVNRKKPLGLPCVVSQFSVTLMSACQQKSNWVFTRLSGVHLAIHPIASLIERELVWRLWAHSTVLSPCQTMISSRHRCRFT